MITSVPRMWISRKKRWQQILKNHTYKGIESPIPIPPLGIVRLRAPIVLGSLLTKQMYSSVPNRRIGPNKRAGGKILKKH